MNIQIIPNKHTIMQIDEETISLFNQQLKILNSQPIQQKNQSESLIFRLKSKEWESRLEAYKLITVDSQLDYDCVIWMIQDTQPKCQLLALKIAETFFGRNIITEAQQKELFKILIERVHNSYSSDEKIKEAVNDIAIKMFPKFCVAAIEIIEIELQNKNPKVVKTTISLLKQLILKFGLEKLNKLKSILPIITKLKQSSYTSVRELSRDFLKDLDCQNKQMGIHVESNDEKTNDVGEHSLQLVQINQKEEIIQVQQNDKVENINDQLEKVVNILEEIDMFHNFPEQWCQRVLTLDWEHKLLELKLLLNAVQTTKIKSTNGIHYVIELLQNLIDDVNIGVSNLSIQIVGYMVQGLGKRFDYYKLFLRKLLSKLSKQKKISQTTLSTIQNMINYQNLDDFHDDFFDFLIKKPSCTINILKLIKSYIDFTNIETLKSQFKIPDLLSQLNKLLSHKKSQVRAEALSLLALSSAKIYDGKLVLDLQGERLYNYKNQVKTNRQSQNKPAFQPLIQLSCFSEEEFETLKEELILPNVDFKLYSNLFGQNENIQGAAIRKIRMKLVNYFNRQLLLKLIYLIAWSKNHIFLQFEISLLLSQLLPCPEGNEIALSYIKMMVFMYNMNTSQLAQQTLPLLMDILTKIQIPTPLKLPTMVNQNMVINQRANTLVEFMIDYSQNWRFSDSLQKGEITSYLLLAFKGQQVITSFSWQLSFSMKLERKLEILTLIYFDFQQNKSINFDQFVDLIIQLCRSSVFEIKFILFRLCRSKVFYNLLTYNKFQVIFDILWQQYLYPTQTSKMKIKELSRNISQVIKHAKINYIYLHLSQLLVTQMQSRGLLQQLITFINNNWRKSVNSLKAEPLSRQEFILILQRIDQYFQFCQLNQVELIDESDSLSKCIGVMLNCYQKKDLQHVLNNIDLKTKVKNQIFQYVVKKESDQMLTWISLLKINFEKNLDQFVFFSIQYNFNWQQNIDFLNEEQYIKLGQKFKQAKTRQAYGLPFPRKKQ